MSLIERAMAEPPNPKKPNKPTNPESAVANTPSSDSTDTVLTSTTHSSGHYTLDRAEEYLAQASRANKTPLPSESSTPRSTRANTRGTARIDLSERPSVKIGLERLRERGMLTPDGSNMEINAEFRVIKRPLLDNAFVRKLRPQNQQGEVVGNTVMITSAMPGEGKSFCAMNLAISLAMEPDHSVILIDADVHRFTVMRELGIEPQLRDQRGLLDLLLDPSLPIEECIYRTDIDKLSIIPFGRFHARATELFGSRAMQDRIAALSARFSDSMIVFDCPPVLATTEARVLAPMLGQTVMVIEAERTPREKIKEALSMLESANVVGTILNKNRAKSSQDYYGYYGHEADAA